MELVMAELHGLRQFVPKNIYKQTNKQTSHMSTNKKLIQKQNGTG